jgi:hypothetical protein
MFTLLTGHYVRNAKAQSEALALATADPPSPRKYRPDLDDDVAFIIEQALELDKSERWPDAPTMLRAVREAYCARERKSGSRSSPVARGVVPGRAALRSGAEVAATEATQRTQVNAPDAALSR